MRSSGSTQNKLQEIRTSKGIRGYYERGKFLTIAEVQSRLASNEGIQTVGKTMLENIENIRSDEFLRVPLEFPVLALQHVTSHENAEKILKSKSFEGRIHERPEFNDLSFWSADVSSDVIETARHQAYEAMRTVVKAEELETFHKEIKEQFANSAAFDRSASRYGNFKFSFPLSLLLSRYKTQHCKGGEPQLRILGTDIYKQEIAHYIVVHSPHTEVFKDLQKVPAMTTRSHDNSVVCWMDETLYWRPESTSSSLLLRVSNNSCTERNDDLQPKSRPIKRPRVPRCVWNHLVVTFHLPNAGKLEIPDRFLLRNLMPCHALQPYLNEDPIQKHQARERIRAFNKNIRTPPDCSGQCSGAEVKAEGGTDMRCELGACNWESMGAGDRGRGLGAATKRPRRSRSRSSSRPESEVPSVRLILPPAHPHSPPAPLLESLLPTGTPSKSKNTKRDLKENLVTTGRSRPPPPPSPSPPPPSPSPPPPSPPPARKIKKKYQLYEKSKRDYDRIKKHK